MKKEATMQDVSDLVNLINEGKLESSGIFADQVSKVKQPVALDKATSRHQGEFDPSSPTIRSYCALKGIFYESCTPNLFPKMKITQVKQLVALSTATVALSTATKFEIQELAKTLPHKDVAIKFNVSRQYVSKLAQNG